MAKIHDVPADNAGSWKDSPETSTFLDEEGTDDHINGTSAPDYLQDEKSGWRYQVIIDIASIGQVQSLVWNEKSNETFKCAEGDENASIYAMFG